MVKLVTKRLDYAHQNRARSFPEKKMLKHGRGRRARAPCAGIDYRSVGHSRTWEVHIDAWRQNRF
ncbi:hypothetical protein PHBOTO_003986 [Pseudozyma hubeiensis]|nr:hypothetical protein PHBOTO_003986 [Pseudozyma hubeiensis]